MKAETQRTFLTILCAAIIALLCAASIQAQSAQSPGNITGTVTDASGALVVGARITLTRLDNSPSQEVLSGENGQFSFAGISPGPFQLVISAQDFVPQAISATLQPGDSYIAAPIVLALAAATSSVQVTASTEEIAADQVKAEETQRVLAVIPNFYVTYFPDTAPLNSRQKFNLAWKTAIDPATFVVVAGIAGIQQAQNNFQQYGQGAQGYGKRFGAAYADSAAGIFIGGAILPSLLKQDPRYFYKGTGGTRFRLLYALANAVICKGDNKRWQPNYSNIVGNLAAGSLSNAYYPDQNRGAAITFENALIGIGATAAANVLQEFVIRKFTSNVPGSERSKT